MSIIGRSVGLLNTKQPLPLTKSVEERTLLTFNGACILLGISMHYLFYLIREGEINTVEGFGNLISKAELEFKKELIKNKKLRIL